MNERPFPLPQPPAKPRVTIEYDSATNSCRWDVPDGIPYMPLIHALELLKTMLVQAQLADMARERDKKIVVPSLVPTFRGN